MVENAENGIEELINSLYEMIQDAWTLPLGSDKCILERERALDILDEMRAILPSDIKTARDIVEHKNEILSAGKREADAIKKHYEERGKKLVEKDEITVNARRRANDMIAAAENRTTELKKAANEYCETLMKKVEETMSSLLDEARRSRQQFRAISTHRNDPPKD